MEKQTNIFSTQCDAAVFQNPAGNSEKVRSDAPLQAITMPITPSGRDYLLRLQELGIFEGSHGEYGLNPNLQPLFEAIHHVLAGGKADTQITHHGNPDVVADLNLRAAQSIQEAALINQRTAFFDGIDPVA